MNFKKIKKIFQKYREIISYLIVGGLTTVVSLVTYYGSTWFFLNPNDAIQLQIANVLSWIFAVAFAYFTNRRFVFKSKNPNMWKEAISFTSSRILTLFMDMAIMFILVTMMNINDKIAKLVVQVIVTVANYIFSKIFVFGERKKRIGLNSIEKIQ